MSTKVTQKGAIIVLLMRNRLAIGRNSSREKSSISPNFFKKRRSKKAVFKTKLSSKRWLTS